MRSRRAACVAVAIAAAAAVTGTAFAQSDGKGAGEESDANGGSAPSCSELQDEADPDALAGWLRDGGEVLETILEEPEQHRAQVLVREVRPRDGAPDCPIRYGYRVDAEYFYPASAIKTVAAVEALRFVEEWNGADRTPELGLDRVLWYRRAEDFDPPSSTAYRWTRGGPLGEIVENSLVVSSNDAFNELFDLVGHERLNRGMWEAGLESLRLHHRMFSKRTAEEQKWSPRIAGQTGTDDEGNPIRKTIRSERRSELELPPIPADRVEVGERHTSFRTGEFHDEPMDFSAKNYISLDDLQKLMVGLHRPNLLEDVDPWGLGPHRKFLAEMLDKHPEADSESKQEELVRRFSPMLPGVREVLDADRISYRNKAGRAYGFHVDNARIVDRETGREVFVAAAVYVNENGALNDDEYEYEEKSYPFLRGVGRAVAQHVIP